MSDDNLLDIHHLCKDGIKRHVIIPLIKDLDNFSSHQNIISIYMWFSVASFYFYVLPHISLGWLVGLNSYLGKSHCSSRSPLTRHYPYLQAIFDQLNNRSGLHPDSSLMHVLENSTLKP